MKASKRFRKFSHRRKIEYKRCMKQLVSLVDDQKAMNIYQDYLVYGPEILVNNMKLVGLEELKRRIRIEMKRQVEMATRK